MGLYLCCALLLEASCRLIFLLFDLKLNARHVLLEAELLSLQRQQQDRVDLYHEFDEITKVKTSVFDTTSSRMHTGLGKNMFRAHFQKWNLKYFNLLASSEIL